MFPSLNLQKSNVFFGAAPSRKTVSQPAKTQEGKASRAKSYLVEIEEQKRLTKKFDEAKKKFLATKKNSPSFQSVKAEYEAAREAVVVAYRPLVEHIAQKFAKRYNIKNNSVVDIDDLRSVGNMALLTAEKAYVPREDCSSLMTYFWEAVTGRLTTFTSKYLGTIKTSSHCLSRYSKIREILKQKNLSVSKMSPLEIARETGYSVRKVKDALEAKVFNPYFVRKPVSFNSIVRKNSFPKQIRVDERLAEAEMREIVRKAADEILTDRQWFVFNAILEGKSGEEIAREMKITNKGVYQHRQLLVKKIQEYIKKLK